MELLKSLLSKLVQPPAPVALEEPPKCVGKEHVFGVSTRCMCGTYTWKEYCRRWDRR